MKEKLIKKKLFIMKSYGRGGHKYFRQEYFFMKNTRVESERAGLLNSF